MKPIRLGCGLFTYREYIMFLYKLSECSDRAVTPWAVSWRHERKRRETKQSPGSNSMMKVGATIDPPRGQINVLLLDYFFVSSLFFKSRQEKSLAVMPPCQPTSRFMWTPRIFSDGGVATRPSRCVTLTTISQLALRV